MQNASSALLCSPAFRLQCGCHLGLRLTEYSKLNHDYSLEENGK